MSDLAEFSQTSPEKTKFQSFETAGPVSSIPAGTRLAALRATFEALGVDGVIVPHGDEYQNETLPVWSQRLAFLTGFTGSAGQAIVLRETALFATDGRYTLQANEQVDATAYTIASTDKAANDWMKANLPHCKIGYDPMLHSRSALERFTEHDATLVPLPDNPVDRIWNDRQAPMRPPAQTYPLALAGQSTAEKVAAIRTKMRADALFVADSAAVTWLMNWRGGAVPHVPLVEARALVRQDGPIIVYAHADVAGALEGADHALVSPKDLLTDLPARIQGKSVQADPKVTPEAILSAIETAGTLLTEDDPAIALKAQKNPAEIAGMRVAHRRDGVAMVRFLAWFDSNAVGLTEIDLVAKLEAFRREVGAIDAAFDTIAGAGPNGAIVHYRVNQTSNRTVAPDDPVLIDSGAQYPDGTTDITRTLVAGAPTDAFRENFTRVLRGHIAIAAQRFPEDTTGAELDPLARAALWQAGLEYRHGTGHGVGAHLSVHEGPCGFSKRSRSALKAGMILSNEPGYYAPGAYGIRIENLVLITEASVPPGGDIAVHGFQTLTAAPIDTRLIVPTLMTPAETAWLNAYHAWVHGTLSGDLDQADRTWLAERCRPVT